MLAYLKKHPEIDCSYIIAGDLNLDERVKNQSLKCIQDTRDIFNIFQSAGLISAYQKEWLEPHGTESEQTYYKSMYKSTKPAKMIGKNIFQPSCKVITPSSHIDYIFADEWMLIDKSVKLGDPIEWLEYSDHLPLIADIKIK